MKIPALSTIVVAAAAMFLALPGLRAQGGMYLKIPDVTGSVVVSGLNLAGSVEVVSFGYGVSRAVSVGANTEASAPNISGIRFTAALDPKAYPGILTQSLVGQVITDVKFLSVASFSPGFVPLEVTFDGVLSSFSSSQAGGDSAGGFMEIEFTPTKITIQTQTLNNQGEVEEGDSVIYDFTSAVAQ